MSNSIVLVGETFKGKRVEKREFVGQMADAQKGILSSLGVEDSIVFALDDNAAKTPMGRLLIALKDMDRVSNPNFVLNKLMADEPDKATEIAEDTDALKKAMNTIIRVVGKRKKKLYFNRKNTENASADDKSSSKEDEDKEG